jgi:hypothetical protein
VVLKRVEEFLKNGYTPLNQIAEKLAVFELKFSEGFRKRQLLINQITDAPRLFLATIVEIERRHQIDAEFKDWFDKFADRYGSLVEKENATRDELVRQLNNHFLRDIFQVRSQFIFIHFFLVGEFQRPLAKFLSETKVA